MSAEGWLASAAGRAAAPAIQRLLEALVTGWPRRGRRLLVVGADPGDHGRWLWSCGFDVTLAVPLPQVLGQARETLGRAAEVQLAQPDHLPWSDDAFDYAVSLFAFAPAQREHCLAEAVRVARSGVVVVFGDALALGRWLPPRLPVGGAWWAVRRALRAAHAGALRSASVLPAPWAARLPVLPPGLGPCCGIRQDLAASPITTPLLAWRHGVEAG